MSVSPLASILKPCDTHYVQHRWRSLVLTGFSHNPRYWTTCDTRLAKHGSWVYTKTLDGPLVVAQNFTLLGSQEVCTSPAFWAGPSGNGFTLETCLTGCRSVYDCKFVSLDSAGTCRSVFPASPMCWAFIDRLTYDCGGWTDCCIPYADLHHALMGLTGTTLTAAHAKPQPTSNSTNEQMLTCHRRHPPFTCLRKQGQIQSAPPTWLRLQGTGALATRWRRARKCAWVLPTATL